MRTQFEFTFGEKNNGLVMHTIAADSNVSRENLNFEMAICSIRIPDLLDVCEFFARSNDYEFTVQIQFEDEMGFNVIKRRIFTHEQVREELNQYLKVFNLRVLPKQKAKR